MSSPGVSAVVSTGSSISKNALGVAKTALADTSQATEPPCKRPRISSQLQPRQVVSRRSMEESYSKYPVYDSMLEGEPMRDRDYYFLEADCVVRVGGTLFRVHRFLLARDASAFQDMFSMPPDPDPEASATLREGNSDTNPIVLYGETEDEFRILLGALYALPSELQQYSTSGCDVSRLITISYLTNKYHFASTSHWAISSLYHVLMKYSSPPLITSGSPIASPISPTRASSFGWDIERLPEVFDLNTCSPELLGRIMDVAMVCGHDELSTLVETRWIDRLWDLNSLALNKDQNQRQGTASCSRADEAKWAVSVADRWEMKRLRGVAYYVCLMEMGDVLSRVAQGCCEAEGTERQDLLPSEEDVGPGFVSQLNQHSGTGPPPPLTPAQMMRLLLGHLSLTHLWDTQLHTQAPAIPTPSPGSCTYHQHGCIYTWVSAWREAARSAVTLKLNTNDVVGRVRSMERQLVGNDGLIVALTPSCRRKALGAVREMMRGLEEGLGEHFRGGIE